MSSAELVDISACPGGDILKCRFDYNPDYTPVIVFIVSIVVIFSIPQLFKLLNRALFERKRKMAPVLVEEKKTVICCRRCRKSRNKDSMDDTQKLSAVAPQQANSAHFKSMKKMSNAAGSDPLTYTEENEGDMNKGSSVNAKNRLPLLLNEKPRKKIID